MPTARKLRLPTEHQEQKVYVEWFKTQFPKYEEAIFSNPNGMHISGDSSKGLSKKTVIAAKMRKYKKEGFKKGVSDIQIPIPRGGYHGLWVEMKRSDKTAKDLSEEQMRHIILMRNLGHKAEWAAGAEEAIRITKEYMDLPIIIWPASLCGSPSSLF